MRRKLALIKMGGSVVTFKDRPLSANNTAINGIARAISSLKEIPIILVHGGGSFGHYWSVRYGMHTRPARYDVHGISIVHQSMIALNQIIIGSMIKNGMNPYTICAMSLTNRNIPLKAKIDQIYAMARTGIVPVTFGDVIHICDGRYSILSGDVIMTFIAKILNPSKVIFAVNTDGIYRSMEERETIQEVSGSKVLAGISGIAREQTPADITGGMRRKVEEALKISSTGVEVMIVNGLKPERVIKAVQCGPENFEGTVVRARSLGSGRLGR
jgi:isopentenyl phosphate kinase